jgi:hypothetical protein
LPTTKAITDDHEYQALQSQSHHESQSHYAELVDTLRNILLDRI